MALAPRATTSAATSTTKPTPYVVPPTQEFDGNDGSWSTFKINIGTPGQDFRVLASTRAGEVFVVVPEGCLPSDGPDCASLRGAEPFQSSLSPGFQSNESSTWENIGQYTVNMEAHLNYTANAIFGYDRVAFGPASEKDALSIERKVVAGVAELDYWMGYLPLGIQAPSFSSLSEPIDSVMMSLWNQSKIPSLSYSYTAGAKYRLKEVFGSLILGGYDSTRFKQNGNDFSFSFAPDSDEILTVAVQSIDATSTLQGAFSFVSEPYYASIDSSIPHLWLPRSVCDSLESAFGLTYDPTTDLYLINSSTHDQLTSLNPSLTFKLANSLTDQNTNFTNIVLPYSALALEASYPYYPNATTYFPIRRAANATQYVLGRTLLQEAYLIVDYERANFSLFPAVFPDPLPSPNIVPILSLADSSDPSSSSKKAPLSVGAIAGIAAGGAALIICLIAGFIYLHRRRSDHKKQKYELASTQLHEAPHRSRPGSSTHPSAPHKSNIPDDPQEIEGTPLTEIAGTRQAEYEGTRKPFLSPQTEPQELPTPSTPGWRYGGGVYYEMEGSETPGTMTREGSFDGRGVGMGMGTGTWNTRA